MGYQLTIVKLKVSDNEPHEIATLDDGEALKEPPNIVSNDERLKHMITDAVMARLPTDMTRELSDAQCATSAGTEETYPLDGRVCFSIQVDDDQMFECFLSFPEVELDRLFLLDDETIAAAQVQDDKLRASVLAYSDKQFSASLATVYAEIECWEKVPNRCEPFTVKMLHELRQRVARGAVPD